MRRIRFAAVALAIAAIGMVAAFGGSRGRAEAPAAESDGSVSRALVAPTTDLIPPVLGVMASAARGEDTRVRLDPGISYHKNIVYLEITLQNGKGGQCTGTIVGPTAILTAAHCGVGERGESPTTAIRVVPGKDGTSEPWGSQYATSNASPRAYTDADDDTYYKFDYDLLFLPNRQLTDKVGLFPGKLTALSDDELRSPSLKPTIVGFAGDCGATHCYNTDVASLLYGSYEWAGSAEALVDVTPDELISEIDAYGGDSGSALFRASDHAILGITVSVSRRYTFAVRVSPQVLTSLLNYCAKEPGCSLNATPPVTASPTPLAGVLGYHAVLPGVGCDVCRGRRPTAVPTPPPGLPAGYTPQSGGSDNDAVVALVNSIAGPATSGLPNSVTVLLGLSASAPVFVNQYVPSGAEGRFTALPAADKASYGRQVLSAIHKAYPKLGEKSSARLLLAIWIDVELPATPSFLAGTDFDCSDTGHGTVDCNYPAMAVRLQLPAGTYEMSLNPWESTPTWQTVP